MTGRRYLHIVLKFNWVSETEQRLLLRRPSQGTGCRGNVARRRAPAVYARKLLPPHRRAHVYKPPTKQIIKIPPRTPPHPHPRRAARIPGEPARRGGGRVLSSFYNMTFASTSHDCPPTNTRPSPPTDPTFYPRPPNWSPSLPPTPPEWRAGGIAHAPEFRERVFSR